MSDEMPKFWLQNGMRKDWVDLRDQPYSPNLAVLRQEFFMDHRVMRELPGTDMRRPFFGIRNQGQSGRCVGYSLANVVDLQRGLQILRRTNATGDDRENEIDTDDPDVVSADMLYRMARFHDLYPRAEDITESQTEGVYSLRSAIKGFYHHGVCLDWPRPSVPREEFRWQSECYVADGPDAKRYFPSVAQAKRARDISLGAYYRLASVLNHFHAALNDAEAIIVSAKTHDGWRAPFGNRNDGKIKWPPDQGRDGSHAFVIVGYDKDGFHVLNSWGENWGGYKGQAGIGLWSYADWARNIIDGWVLRLGVHAPNAFGESIGEKGTKGLMGKIASGSPPCLELIGHYMHLDDGVHVTTGAYPSFIDGWSKTRRYLSETFKASHDADLNSHKRRYKGVLVWIPGSFEGIQHAFGAAAQRKNRIKGMDLYPYTLFWGNGFAGKSIELLQGLFKSCEEQAGSTAEHLDTLIENEVRGVGRAIWRDMEMAAKRAIAGLRELPLENLHDMDEGDVEPGPIADFFEELLSLIESSGTELHIVTEGAGVLILHEALAYLSSKRRRSGGAEGTAGLPKDLISSVHVVLPAIDLPRAGDQVLPLIAAMNTGARKRAHVYVPDVELEGRVCFGAYGKSILHLVSRAFEDRMPGNGTGTGTASDGAAATAGMPRTFLGMADGPDSAGLADDGTIVRLNTVSDPRFQRIAVPQTVLTNDPEFFIGITDRITALSDPKSHPVGD